MFAIVDVETTGGHASGHDMTEIAVVLHDGSRIVDTYSTLLKAANPIPLSIQKLTGITPEMLEDAPCFSEVAEEIREILGGHTFVAHNVNFDYAFVSKAFDHCGISYRPRRLCSVRYARRVERGLTSYSLKQLCRHFGVRNANPHRALGDAMATAEIMGLLLERDKTGQWEHMIKMNSGEFNLPAHLDSKEYHSLPESPGVYYFLDKNAKPLYIGKARNIKKRVASHFITGKATKRSQAFKREIYHISFELTGSELLASLLEDHEIRQHWPPHNRAQKNPKRRYAIYDYQNQKGIRCLAVNRISSQAGFIREFPSQHQAVACLNELVEKYRLKANYCGLPYINSGQVDEDSHNNGVERLLKEIKEQSSSFIVKTPGRNRDEEGFACVEDGRLAGIGFISRDCEISSLNEVKSHMRQLRNSITTQAIINKLMEEGKYEMIRL